MTHEPQPTSSLFTQVDITAGTPFKRSQETTDTSVEQISLLRNILAAQDRNNELLEEFINQMGAAQKQRTAELGQWKQSNPDLARKCRQAAESLSRVQVEFLTSLTGEVDEHGDALMDGEFMLTEFVDRFGPRLAHLNGLLQVLAQLSSTPAPANSGS